MSFWGQTPFLDINKKPIDITENPIYDFIIKHIEPNIDKILTSSPHIINDIYHNRHSIKNLKYFSQFFDEQKIIDFFLNEAPCNANAFCNAIITFNESTWEKFSAEQMNKLIVKAKENYLFFKTIVDNIYPLELALNLIKSNDLSFKLNSDDRAELEFNCLQKTVLPKNSIATKNKTKI